MRNHVSLAVGLLAFIASSERLGIRLLLDEVDYHFLEVLVAEAHVDLTELLLGLE